MDGCPSGNAGRFRKLPEGATSPVMTTGKGQVMGKTPDCGDRKAAEGVELPAGRGRSDSGAGGTAQKLAGMRNNKRIRAARLMFSRPARALAVQSIPCAGWMIGEGWPCRRDGDGDRRTDQSEVF